jgi:hypothetical protein
MSTTTKTNRQTYDLEFKTQAVQLLHQWPASDPDRPRAGRAALAIARLEVTSPAQLAQ